jgi:HK97 family phage major capsid protein
MGTTLAHKVASVSANVETATRAGEFSIFCKAMAARSAGLPVDSLPERVQRLLKAPVTPGSTTGAPWSVLADYDTAGRAFLASLASASAFDAALPFMKSVPLASRVVATTAAVTGATPSELNVKPVSQIAIGVDDIRPRKAAAIVVVSKELLRFSGPGASLFQQELRNGVVAATDSAFLSELYASVTPTASAGSTTANTLTDLGVLLSALTLGTGSKVFIAMSPANLAKLMTKVSSGAGTAYPTLSLQGGEWLNGIAVIPTTSVPSGAIIAFDAAGFAGATEPPVPRSIAHGDVVLNTTPDSPATAATVTQNLWQFDQVALYIERLFGFAAVRTGAVAAISGAAY